MPSPRCPEAGSRLPPSELSDYGVLGTETWPLMIAAL